MARGYAGALLYIDLAKEKFLKEPLRMDMAEKFIGGKGFTAKLLYELLKPNVDPLNPENVIIFATGPLNGTPWPGNKNILATKSPLTSIYMDSYFSGGFGPELKFAGYDAVIIKGRADKPICLWIDDSAVDFRNASHIWGKTTYETYDMVKEEIGDRTAKVVCIGPAGENLVRFACVDADVHRQAGRCGGGAVMGSKNLKAIAVRGSGELEVFALDKLMELAREFAEKLKTTPDTRGYSTYGTPACLPFANVEALWPYNNWKDQFFEEGAKEYSGETQTERVWIKHRAGYGCTMMCEKVAIIKKGSFAGAVVHGAEYETVGVLGSNCGYANLEAILKANLLCDYYGLDTISTGAVIAFAMECYEKGILNKEDVAELDLKFGNYKAVPKMIETIAYRRGIGDMLADGVKRASEKIGKGCERYAVHIKGLETPAWGVRGTPSMALQYVTVDRGGCHQRGWPILYETSGVGPTGEKIERVSLKGKAICSKWDQDYTSAMGTLVSCDITRYGIDPKYFHTALSLVTGWEIDLKEFMKIGERVWNLIRLINVREGVSRKDEEELPRRFREEPLPSGPAKGHRVTPDDLKAMLNEYYQLRGWNTDGMPTKKKLAELELP